MAFADSSPKHHTIFHSLIL